MRVVVTGASGFLGSRIVPALAEGGHEVLALSRDWTGKTVPAGVETRSHALTAAAAASIATWSPDACVHAAWIATPGLYLESPENESLIDASFEFLSTLQRRGARRTIALGTCIEYARDGDGPLHEVHGRIAPDSPYARAKHQLHQRLRACLGPALVWARVFFPYGRGEDPRRLPSWLVRQYREGIRPTLRTPGDTNDYIHAADVASAVRFLLEHPSPPPVINLGTGEGVMVSDLARCLATLTGRPDLAPPPGEPGQILIADPTLLAMHGWRPGVPLSAGLEDLVSHLLTAPSNPDS